MMKIVIFELFLWMAGLALGHSDHESSRDRNLQLSVDPVTIGLDPLSPITVPCCDPALRPGPIGNSVTGICKEGSACCPDGTWSCSIGDGQTFPCGGVQIKNPDGPICEEACCDSTVTPLCLLGTAACCPSGTWGCPNGDTNSYLCGDLILEDPQGPMCPTPAPQRPIDPLPPVTSSSCCDPTVTLFCLIGTQACCPDGTWTCPNGNTNSYPCGELLLPDPKGPVCCCDPTQELVQCPFGEYGCCPSGDWVCPDPATNLYLCDNVEVEVTKGIICDSTLEPAVSPVASPSCCDPTVTLFCLIGTQACCPDGTWTCPNGNTNSYPCGELLLPDPKGPICCCDLSLERAPCPSRGEYGCCPNGILVCPDPTTNLYLCDGVEVEFPQGIACDRTLAPAPALPPVASSSCCDPNEVPLCKLGTAACCPGGVWACPDGNTNFYVCGDLYLEDPQGPICCCDLSLERAPCPSRGEYGCCPNGNLVCPDPTTNLYLCDGVEVEFPQGIACDRTLAPAPALPPVASSSCCDPNEVPLCKLGTAACCPGGVWACPDGNTNFYVCGDLYLEDPQGPICCCDLSLERAPCPSRGEYGCCPNGNLVCPDPTTNLYLCDGVEVEFPQGIACDRTLAPAVSPVASPSCCDPTITLFCLIGTQACCPDGTWTCPNGNTNSYPCGELLLPDPKGPVCCCDLSLERAPCPSRGEYGCCPNGILVCPDPTTNLYLCDGVEVEFPQGIACDRTLAPAVSPVASPSCCDPTITLFCLIGTQACCPDGTWTCPNGNTNSYPCGELLLPDPKGPVCCCDLSLERAPCPSRGEYGCCPNGILVCPDPTTNLYLCDGVEVEFPQGIACDRTLAPAPALPPVASSSCCDPNEVPLCKLGTAACCPGGVWACPDGNTNFYVCGDLYLEDPQGPICPSPAPQLPIESLSPISIKKSCCDPNQEPVFCWEGYECCADGTWKCFNAQDFPICGIGIQNPSAVPVGKVCPCCSPRRPSCPTGVAACCKEQGTWVCPNANNLYLCGDVQLANPQGSICKPIDIGVEPSWWQLLQRTLTPTTPNLKRCFKRPFPPRNGTKCAVRPKTCFFGNQECQGTDLYQYPNTSCSCSGGAGGGTWSCESTRCP